MQTVGQQRRSDLRPVTSRISCDDSPDRKGRGILVLRRLRSTEYILRAGNGHCAFRGRAMHAPTVGAFLHIPQEFFHKKQRIKTNKLCLS